MCFGKSGADGKDLSFYTQCPPIILLHFPAKLLIALGLRGVDEKALGAQFPCS